MPFASFEIKSGEVVYIGDLYFTFTKQRFWIKGKMDLEVKDSYQNAVSYFRSSYPQFKDKTVIKRLAQPGVSLNKHLVGTFW